jgi:hypothetical protein
VASLAAGQSASVSVQFGDPSNALIGDSGEAERIFRMESERHSGMNPNTIGA